MTRVHWQYRQYFIRIDQAKKGKAIYATVSRVKGGFDMARRGGKMSENLKAEIAKELGVYNVVKDEGWGSVSSRDCGNMVSKAIEIAERNVAKNQK